MNFKELSEKLDRERTHLQEFRVASLTVFGSVARDEARPDSDIDLLVEFEGLPTFDRYMRLKFFLEDLLEHRIDLATRLSIRPELRPAIEHDARRVA